MGLRLLELDQNSAGVDAAGRSRVSQVTTIGEYKLDYDRSYLFSTAVNNATAAYNSSNSGILMTLTGSASGDYAIAATRGMHPYFNGKSHLVEVTLSDFGDETNVQKICGYYSTETTGPYSATKDGIFVINDSGTLRFQIWKNGSSIVDTNIDSWANENGISIDRTKFLVFAFDFLYLGGTAVRLLIKIDGIWYPVTKYVHANSVDGTFIGHPAQPIRAEIRSTGAYTGTPTFIFHCGVVVTEGGINNVGETRSVHNGSTAVDADSVGTWYALKGLRIDSATRHTSMNVESITAISTTNDSFLWGLWLNPTVAGTFTYTDVPYSRLEEATGALANTVTAGSNGRLLKSGYGTRNSAIEVPLLDTVDKIGSALDGTPDTLVLAVLPLSSNLNILGSINYKEF